MKKNGDLGDHFRVGDHFGVGIISGDVQVIPIYINDQLLRSPRTELFFVVSHPLLFNGHLVKMYHTNAINILCMAFSGLSPASFRLVKEELETLLAGQFVV